MNIKAIFIGLFFVTIVLFLIYSSYKRNQEIPYRIRVLLGNHYKQTLDKLVKLSTYPAPEPDKQLSTKIHVFYVHYISTGDQTTNENLVFFMNFAYSPCNPVIDYTIVLNYDDITGVVGKLLKLMGDELYEKLINCSIQTDSDTHSTSLNTRVVYRKNKGGDLCAYSEIMNNPNWILIEKLYSYFFFINSSTRGPFLPAYYLKPWWNIFTDVFSKFPDTVAVGPYLSCEPRPHIQSFFISVDKRGLPILKNVYRCPKPDEGKQAWIYDTEVKLGTEFLQAGFAIRSFLFVYGVGIGNSTQISKSSCDRSINPFNTYPLSQTVKKELFGNDVVAKSNFAINLFETTWIKFKHNHDEYSQKYVPLYSKLMYKRLKEGSLPL